jgi:hypothetical protein
MEVISRDGTTAQIDPLRFCKWLKSSVEERGVKIVHPATATEVLRDARGVLSGVRIVKSQEKQTQDCECCTDWGKLEADTHSTMHTPPHHLRRLVSTRLLDPLP